MCILQLFVNGIVAGGTYALVALGFTLIYGTTRFFHFAHGAVYAVGAYAAYALSVQLHLPLVIALPSAIAASIVLGMLTETLVYRPLRQRHSSVLVLLIASLGLYILIQNFLSLAFGEETRTLQNVPVQEGLNIAGAYVTPLQLMTLVTTAVLFPAVALFLNRTGPGRALRAVAADPELVAVTGVNADRIILFAFGLGSALAAVAAILVAFDVDMTPTMGMNALLMGMVATVIGGVGSVPGAALGGLLLGLAQHLGVWKIGAQWQDAIAFAVLLVFLLFRPYGIFGRKLRKAEI